MFIVELFIEYFFVVWRHQQRRAEADCENRDLQNIVDPWKDCGSFVDEKFRALHPRICWTLTIKANISIYLVPHRLSTDTKTRDLEWLWMAVLR